MALASKIAKARDSYVAPVTFPKAPPDKAPKQSGRQDVAPSYKAKPPKELHAARKEKVSKLPEIPSGNTSGIDVSKDKADARKTIAQMNADQPEKGQHKFVTKYINTQKSIAGEVKAKETEKFAHTLALGQKAKDDPSFDLGGALKKETKARAPEARQAIRAYRQVSKEASKFKNPDHFSHQYASPKDKEELTKANQDTLSTLKSAAGVKTKSEVDAEIAGGSTKKYTKVPSNKELDVMDKKARAKSSGNIDFSNDDQTHAKTGFKSDVYDRSNDKAAREFLLPVALDKSAQPSTRHLAARGAAPTPKNKQDHETLMAKTDKAIVKYKDDKTKASMPSIPGAFDPNRETSLRKFTDVIGKPGEKTPVLDKFHDLAVRSGEEANKRAKSSKIRANAMSAASVWRGGQIRAKQQKNWKPTVPKKEDKPN
jgi:hypothetical protein